MNKILEKSHWEGFTILEDEKRSPEPYDIISENNELVSLETNLIGSIILAYRKLNYLHYFDYYTFKKTSLK